eukprot:gene24804-31185_t
MTVVSALSHSPPGSDIQTPTAATLVKTGPYGSKLYKFEVAGSVYADAPQLIDLTASSLWQQGYDHGYLLGKESKANFDNLMFALLGDNKALTEVVNIFIDWQWNSFLSKQLPDEYKQELEGMSAGGKAAGLKVDIGVLAGRGITFANLPGTLSNFKYILKDELAHPAIGDKFQGMTSEEVMDIMEKLSVKWAGLTCSMYGVWGSRTEEGRLFTGRNLDWLHDTGISTYKLITVHHPPGLYSHATIGWAGIWGAITGISSQGITAHEANLESDDITFRGFPWIARLRHVMAHAKNIDEALKVWTETNSTVGFNHGFGSANDGRAVVLETMAGHSAVFESNDPREKDLVVNGTQIGLPRPDAIYRTNHGYDDYTKKHYIETDKYYIDSINRYQLFPAVFDQYAAEGKLMGFREAVNMTAIVGHKSSDLFYECQAPYDTGSNILSVTYDPAALIAYTAWENHNPNEEWVPAACNTYLKIDLKQWF